MILSQKSFEVVFSAGMYDLTGKKQWARKKGYYHKSAIDKTQLEGLYVGQVVEVAFCHLLGILQSALDYRFNVVLTAEIDMNGVDLIIDTDRHGKKYIQLKQSYKFGTRKREAGTYMVATSFKGSSLMKNFMRFYHMDMTYKARIDEDALYRELDNVWCDYMAEINKVYYEMHKDNRELFPRA